MGSERAACNVAASVEAMFAGSARHGTPGGGPRTFGPRQPRVLARSRLPWRRAGARAAEAMVAAEAVAAAEAAEAAEAAAAAEAAEAVERRRREEEPAEAAAKREARAEEEEVAVVVEEEAVVEEEVVEERRRPSVGAGLRIEHSEAGGTHAASGVGSALISWSGSVVSGQGQR